MSVADLRLKIDKLSNEKLLIQCRLKAAEASQTLARVVQIDLDAVENTVQFVATKVQTNFGLHVGALVTKAMHHVFNEMRREFFAVNFRPNRGKTECQLRIATEKGKMQHPYDCSGGGVWDTLAFALRCACLVLEQPQSTRFLVLDEPFKFLHGADCRRKALSMLVNTCETLGIQALVIHQTDDKKDSNAGLEAMYDHPGCLVYKVRLTGYEQSVIEAVTV